MSEFKVGDEVYEVSQFPIKKCKIIRMPEKDTYGYYMLGHDFIICKPQKIYKNKNEAIDAMIQRLEEMRNEK